MAPRALVGRCGAGVFVNTTILEQGRELVPFHFVLAHGHRASSRPASYRRRLRGQVQSLTRIIFG
jgi:hypothetical protein